MLGARSHQLAFECRLDLENGWIEQDLMLGWSRRVGEHLVPMGFNLYNDRVHIGFERSTKPSELTHRRRGRPAVLTL
jgi:hypothetical protein